MSNQSDRPAIKELHNFVRAFLSKLGIELFGVADLSGLGCVKDDNGVDFRTAISFAVPMNPGVMAGIKNGPNQLYAEEYARVNALIYTISDSLAGRLNSLGFQAKALPASDRTDRVNLKGDFPHKTAATRAGLGWIGRNCQLITKQLGPWLRLGTVFFNTSEDSQEFEVGDLCDEPVTRHFCGDCQECVDACPADALVGNAWHPGLAREELLDVQKCDDWKKENYYQFHKGHNCGICAAVCPFGTKQMPK